MTISNTHVVVSRHAVETALQLLQRVQLTGAEAHIYMQTVASLNASLATNADAQVPTPNGVAADNEPRQHVE